MTTSPINKYVTIGIICFVAGVAVASFSTWQKDVDSKQSQTSVSDITALTESLVHPMLMFVDLNEDGIDEVFTRSHTDVLCDEVDCNVRGYKLQDEEYIEIFNSVLETFPVPSERLYNGYKTLSPKAPHGPFGSYSWSAEDQYYSRILE